MMASDFESLTAHLGRNRELKMVIKEMREEARWSDQRGWSVGVETFYTEIERAPPRKETRRRAWSREECPGG